MGNFDPIRHILAGVEQNPHWQGRQQLRQIQTHWGAIVGEAVARHTRPITLHNQQLKVATTSQAWAQNLMFERNRLRAKLNQYLQTLQTPHLQNSPLTPPIQQLHFSAGQWPKSKSKPTSTSTKSQPTRQRDRPATPPRQHAQRQPAPSPPQSLSPQSPPPSPPKLTPQDAFSHWSEQIQTQRQHLPPCPICNVPTPPAELKRWQCCSLCATRQWRSN